MKAIKGLLLHLYYLIFFKLFNFLIPNLRKISSNKVTYGSIPFCYQFTKISGSGKVEIGKGCVFGYKLGGFYRGGSIEIQPRYKNAKILIGNNVATNNNIFICAANLIEIGDHSLIGQNVTIMDFEAHGLAPDKRREVGKIGYVKLSSNIWIGNNVIILKNTEIGENTVIAAGAVVSGKFPANVIIGGVPAKVIKAL